MSLKEHIKRVESKGFLKYYQFMNDNIEILHCKQTWLYTNTGYYITLNNGINNNNPILKKCFKSAKLAAIAAVHAKWSNKVCNEVTNNENK